MAEIYWTAEALKKLADIEAYITHEEHAPMVAKKTLRRLTSRVSQIALVANSGRTVPDYQDPAIREILEKPYRIIYRREGNRIDILSLMHYRQLLPSKSAILKSVEPSAG